MNLRKKKQLAARTLNVGIDKIRFNPEKINEIKEAITAQDIRDLVKEKTIIIKEIKGKKKKQKRKTRKRAGKIKKKMRTRKQDYVKLTRKLRKHLFSLRKQGKIDKEKYEKLRRQIRASSFRSKSHLQEQI